MSPAWLACSLVAAHFVLDYPLQGDTTAREKNPRSTTDLQRHVPWGYWMTAHAISHAAAVAYLTGSLWCCAAEFVVHFVTDWNKCLGRISIHADQAIHLGTKAAFVLVAVLS